MVGVKADSAVSAEMNRAGKRRKEPGQIRRRPCVLVDADMQKGVQGPFMAELWHRKRLQTASIATGSVADGFIGLQS
jgi:hypothetical protein